MNMIPDGVVSPEVLAIAEQYEVANHLGPFCEATLRLFPSALGLRMQLEDDPEIRDLTFLVVSVSVPEKDVPDFVRAKRQWNGEFFRVFPSPYQCPFILDLQIVSA